MCAQYSVAHKVFAHILFHCAIILILQRKNWGLERLACLLNCQNQGSNQDFMFSDFITTQSPLTSTWFHYFFLSSPTQSTSHTVSVSFKVSRITIYSFKVRLPNASANFLQVQFFFTGISLYINLRDLTCLLIPWFQIYAVRLCDSVGF